MVCRRTIEEGKRYCNWNRIEAGIISNGGDVYFLAFRILVVLVVPHHFGHEAPISGVSEFTADSFHVETRLQDKK
jgi:hypothetical protein